MVFITLLCSLLTIFAIFSLLNVAKLAESSKESILDRLRSRVLMLLAFIRPTDSKNDAKLSAAALDWIFAVSNVTKILEI